MKRSELEKQIKEIIIELLSEESVAWNPSNKNQAKQQIDTSRLDSDTKKQAKAEIDQNKSGIINNI